jgi:lysyl-tRNA synthetase class 2
VLSAYKFAEKLIDLGDFVGIKGELFYTHKGELTIFAEEFTFLSKAIQPLPEKWHGVNDQETLYRERNLDLLTNESSFARFKLRSKIIREMRRFFESK